MVRRVEAYHNPEPSFVDSPEELHDLNPMPEAVRVEVVNRQGPNAPTQGFGRSINVLTVETILPPDPRRKRAVVMCALQGCFIGTEMQLVQGSPAGAQGAFALPVNVPVEITDNDGWYCISASTTLPSLVSVMTETDS